MTTDTASMWEDIDALISIKKAVAVVELPPVYGQYFDGYGTRVVRGYGNLKPLGHSQDTGRRNIHSRSADDGIKNQT